MSAVVDRRGFLRFAAGAAVGVAGLGLVGCDVASDEDHWENERRAAELRRAEAARRAALFVGAEEVAALGERYLVESADGQPDVAYAQLAGLVDELVALPSDDDVVGWIEAAIADDFAAGRATVLEGWVMSVTGLELCTLLHLEG